MAGADYVNKISDNIDLFADYFVFRSNILRQYRQFHVFRNDGIFFESKRSENRLHLHDIMEYSRDVRCYVAGNDIAVYDGYADVEKVRAKL